MPSHESDAGEVVAVPLKRHGPRGRPSGRTIALLAVAALVLSVASWATASDGPQSPSLLEAVGRGVQVEWLRVAGTAGDDATLGVAIGPWGDVWTVGVERGRGADDAHGAEPFVVVERRSRSGDRLWRYALAARLATWASRIAVDGAGAAFVAGEGPDGGFLAAIDGAGSLVWHRDLGADFDRRGALEVDAKGFLWVRGAELARWRRTGEQMWSASVPEVGTSSRAFALAPNAAMAWVVEAIGDAAGRDGWTLVRYDGSGDGSMSSSFEGRGRVVDLAVGPRSHVWVLLDENGMVLSRIDPGKGEVWRRQILHRPGDILRPVALALDRFGNASAVGALVPGEATATVVDGYGSIAVIARVRPDGVTDGVGLVGTGRADIAHDVAAGATGEVVVVGATEWMLGGSDWPYGWSDGFVMRVGPSSGDSTCVQ